MKITEEIDIYVPSGFYCVRNGNNKCGKLLYNKRVALPYSCSIFGSLLRTDSEGNGLKCERCLLAERKARELQ